MKNKPCRAGMFSILLILGIFAIGCDNGNGTTFNNDAGDLAGTWVGTVMGQNAYITVSNSGWTISVPNLSYADTGSFNRVGNSATLFTNTNGKNVGTANIIDSGTIQIVLNGNSAAPGSYTMTRQ